jgi:DNA-binding winged helix-turn-helix (wHTH) protein
MEGKADVIETVRGVGYRFKETSMDKEVPLAQSDEV